jgi:Ca-activated chloride channel family protein
MFSLSGFVTPWWFLLVFAVLALGAGYVVVQRMLRRKTLRFSNLALLEKVARKRSDWWRHAPPALLLIALALLTVALAGPTAEQKVPRNRATVLLVIDTSLSMEATDVEPTRFKAAQDAAKQFTDGLTPGINLGLISFSGSATVLVSPTTDRGQVRGAIDGLKLGEATATGEAIAAALQAVKSFGSILSGAEGPPPARIVLMSDGKQTVPADLDAPRGAFTQAKDAKSQNVPISTISFGTEGGMIELQGERRPVPVDDDSLREVAELSGGEFYKAATAEQLKEVYATLGEQIGYETKHADSSKPWLMLGTLLALAAAGGALVFSQRLP